jgi:hypothetical protein
MKNTVSINSFMARMKGDEEPVVTVRKSMVTPPDPDDPDQRGMYVVEVRVEL